METEKVSKSKQLPRFCTIRELSAASGLGAGTVHRALSGAHSVKPETARRVLRALSFLNQAAIDRYYDALPEPDAPDSMRISAGELGGEAAVTATMTQNDGPFGAGRCANVRAQLETESASEWLSSTPLTEK